MGIIYILVPVSACQLLFQKQKTFKNKYAK